MHTRFYLRSAGMLLLLVDVTCAAQSPAQSSTQSLIEQVITFSERFQSAVPSLVCTETIHSQELHKGTVRKEVIAQGTLRVIRDPGKPLGFADSRHLDTENGAPAGTHHVNYPYFVSGSFVGSLAPLHRNILPCYSFRSFTTAEGMAGLEYSVDAMHAQDPGCSNIPSGYQKRYVLDRDGNVTHVERHMDESAAKRLHDVVYLETDYASQTLGNTTLWLPVRTLSHDASNQGRMITTYSNFHRFSGSATIVTDSVTEAH